MDRRVILVSKFNPSINVDGEGVGKPSPKRAIELAGIDPKLSDLPMASGKLRESEVDVRTHQC